MVGYYRLGELGYRLPAGPQVLPPEAFAAVDGATGLLGAAEERAAEIVAGAEDGFRRECERGYQEGLARGRLEAVDRLLRESETLDSALRGLEQDLATLVAGCVRKLVDEFDDTARVEAVVRGALTKMRREKRAELRVAPARLAHFRSVIASIVAGYPDIDLVEVVEDSTLGPNQIVLESAIGRVEGDLGARMDELDGVIRGVLAAPAEAAAS